MDEQTNDVPALQPYQWPQAPSAASAMRPPTPGAGATQGGQPRGGPDAGSPRAGLVAWALLLIAVGTLFALSRIVPLFESEEQPAKTKIVAPTMADPIALTIELMVKLARSGFADDPSARAGIVAQIDAASLSPDASVADRLRGAIAIAEVEGKEEGLKRLDKIEPEAIEKAGLEDDAAMLRTMLTGDAGSVSGEQADTLIARHGWFGRLALLLDAPKESPDRAELLRGGGYLIAMAALLCVVVVVALVGGLMCAVIAGFKIAGTLSGRGPPRALVPPSPGGSVYLETTAVFILCFLGMHTLLGVWAESSGASDSTKISVTLVAQWCLLPTIFWARLRGVPWARWRREIGWHAPRGVLREIGAGLFMYLAGLPVLAFAMLVTIAIVAVRAAFYHQAGEPAPSPDNPLLRLIAESEPWQMALLVLLATAWAPIVEESIFRGSLFRHLRSRRGVLASAIVSALFFGILHSYEILLLAPVISLGFVFALMREWRGSVIPSAVAHAFHNGTIMIFVLLLRGAL